MGAMTRTNAGAKSHKSRNRRRYQLLFMALPLMIMVIMFAYVPLFGWAYAFFDYKPGVPLFSNEFVGFKYFEQFLTDRWDMHRVMKKYAGTGAAQLRRVSAADDICYPA